jgi:hypothetical protein
MSGDLLEDADLDEPAHDLIRSRERRPEQLLDVAFASVEPPAPIQF